MNTPNQSANSIKLIHAKMEEGVTCFDTTEVYGPFASEELAGGELELFTEQIITISYNKHVITISKIGIRKSLYRGFSKSVAANTGVAYPNMK